MPTSKMLTQCHRHRADCASFCTQGVYFFLFLSLLTKVPRQSLLGMYGHARGTTHPSTSLLAWAEGMFEFLTLSFQIAPPLDGTTMGS